MSTFQSSCPRPHAAGLCPSSWAPLQRTSPPSCSLFQSWSLPSSPSWSSASLCSWQGSGCASWCGRWWCQCRGACWPSRSRTCGRRSPPAQVHRSSCTRWKRGSGHFLCDLSGLRAKTSSHRCCTSTSLRPPCHCCTSSPPSWDSSSAPSLGSRTPHLAWPSLNTTSLQVLAPRSQCRSSTSASPSCSSPPPSSGCWSSGWWRWLGPPGCCPHCGSSSLKSRGRSWLWWPWCCCLLMVSWLDWYWSSLFNSCAFMQFLWPPVKRSLSTNWLQEKIPWGQELRWKAGRRRTRMAEISKWSGSAESCPLAMERREVKVKTNFPTPCWQIINTNRSSLCYD